MGSQNKYTMATSCLSTLYVLVTVVVAIQARETLNFFSLVKSTTWTSTSTTTVVKTIPFCASLLEVEGPCLGHSSLPDIHPSSASKMESTASPRLTLEDRQPELNGVESSIQPSQQKVLRPLIIYSKYSYFKDHQLTKTVTASTPALKTVFSTTAKNFFIVGACIPPSFHYPICES